jgi:hypothetical protein
VRTDLIRCNKSEIQAPNVRTIGDVPVNAPLKDSSNARDVEIKM